MSFIPSGTLRHSGLLLRRGIGHSWIRNVHSQAIESRFQPNPEFFSGGDGWNAPRLAASVTLRAGRFFAAARRAGSKASGSRGLGSPVTAPNCPLSDKLASIASVAPVFWLSAPSFPALPGARCGSLRASSASQWPAKDPNSPLKARSGSDLASPRPLAPQVAARQCPSCSRNLQRIFFHGFTSTDAYSMRNVRSARNRLARAELSRQVYRATVWANGAGTKSFMTHVFVRTGARACGGNSARDQTHRRSGTRAFPWT